jgi:site-specific DNA-methyltransferase (adenine-specific)
LSIDDVLSGDAQFAVVCGDATAVMAALPDGFAAVTYCDPSYGLSQQSTEDVIACLRAWLDGKPYLHSKAGFMQAKWDSWVPGPEAWREVHRCLKPGGYCVAFSSTRTVDLLGIAIRLAGFEIRPGFAWITGQSFPKSLDVSKACDREADVERDVVRVATREGNAERNGDGSQGSTYGDVWGGFTTTSEPVTAAAIQWDGYGTDVKGAYEPLVVARKAIDGTVAHNVQTHGCGALNIDAGRIGTTKQVPGSLPKGDALASYGIRPGRSGKSLDDDGHNPNVGRFPASLALVHDEGCVCEGTTTMRRNLIEGVRLSPSVATDGEGMNGSRSIGQTDDAVDVWTCTATCAVAELGRQSGESASSDRPRHNTAAAQALTPSMNATPNDWTTGGHSDTGTAARFFYQAKASALDRLIFITCYAGCAHHESVAGVKDARASARDASREQPHGFCRACGGVRTHHGHSTVKPLELAKYHARLLSLPKHTNPIALVPFCGSGVEARALLDAGFRVIAIDQDPRYCAMTEFRLGSSEPECDVLDRKARDDADRGDWTKPIRVEPKSEVHATEKQLGLFSTKA